MRLALLALGAVFALGCAEAPSAARVSTTAPSSAARSGAPSLAGATTWLNVDRPLDLEALEGRVVVVDFWTSGCINCIHTLATLKKLEARFDNQPLVVVGIHSPKFDAEGESARLASTLDAYDLHHPVAIDGKRVLWDRWGAEAWPTVAVLDTHGRILAQQAGEPDLEALAHVVTTALHEPGAKLAKGPLPSLVSTKEDRAPLRFPGKVSALGDGRLAVTDTGHHRVVVLRSDGSVEAVIGSGLAGKIDGAFADASFSAPEGASYADGVLYVADTENHTIRAADLRTHTVSTLAGTGRLGDAPLGAEPTPARTTALRSPWDVLARDGKLYVALAGSHQIAVIDLGSGAIRRFAGSGREALTDGSAERAAFAQPSGLATDGKSLFVADPESSAIREIALSTATTKTLVGKGLFDFGDVDGPSESARLQHALGVAVIGRTLYVVDTYNSKLKAFDLETHRLTTIAGGADRAALFEPGGITVDGGRLVVADTHHGRVVTVPLPGTRLVPFALSGLAAPVRGVAVASAADAPSLDPKAPELRLAFRVAHPGRATLRLAWQLPPGTAINEEAPAALRWVSARGLVETPAGTRLHGKEVAAGVSIPVDVVASEAALDGVLDVVTCDVATHSVCVPLRRNVRATIARGDDRLTADVSLPAAVAGR